MKHAAGQLRSAKCGHRKIVASEVAPLQLRAVIKPDSIQHATLASNHRGRHRKPDLFCLGTITFWLATSVASPAQTSTTTNFIRGDFHELNDNGAWSWFMDERTIVDNGRLIVGSVRANGKFADKSLPGWGNVELAVLDLKSGATNCVLLHDHFEQDDHDNPGLLVLPDGRYLAGYSKHGQEPRVYFRVSTRPGDPRAWEPRTEFVTPGTTDARQTWGRGDVFTYCNPMRLTAENGRLYMFHRSVGLDPNYLISDDDGRTWRYGGKLFLGLDGYSPYCKYASNGKDTIHFVCTEDHPRNYDNSLYHAFIRGGNVHGSDGKVVGPLATSTNATLRPWNFTRIYQGGSNNVAWMTDIELGPSGNPVVLFTVQMNNPGLPRGKGGDDHRFHLARWDGTSWQESEIAYAGKRLYPGEDDYTGLGAIDPQNTGVIYISTDADPKTGTPLISAADGKRHHELFRGIASAGDKTWTWIPVTVNSTTDNLRPIVPRWNDPRTALVWMRGSYRANRGEWTTKVVASILTPKDSSSP
jgi:hypothetical protein